MNIKKTSLGDIQKIKINGKILFLGYGAVAKCVLNYFDSYFEYESNNVFIVDKCKEAIYGPNLDLIKKENIFFRNLTSLNFDDFVSEINLKKNDVIIDLTYWSETYYFIKKCFDIGVHYINTSIEDVNDLALGTSIKVQQDKVYEIFQQTKNIRSNVLIECGQNPGLIQHYVFFALNEMNKIFYNSNKDNYSVENYTSAIDNCKIGTILLSEIDNMCVNDESTLLNDLLYNTWSVAGLVGEGLDKTELVCGKKNLYIKPQINEKYIDLNKTRLVNSENVFFLKKCGIYSYLNSICPVLNKDNCVDIVTYYGSLIHHGEIFDLEKIFKENSPFMSYVYMLNEYAQKSIQNYFNNKNNDELDLKMLVSNNYNSYKVFDNIEKKNKELVLGSDSIGCTIFCGENSIEKIYWCGSILSSSDENVDINFTPTVVQVAAGVLSGLSFILEPENKNGLYTPRNLDTVYILNKSSPLLGKLFFTEIPSYLFQSFDFKQQDNLCRGNPRFPLAPSLPFGKF